MTIEERFWKKVNKDGPTTEKFGIGETQVARLVKREQRL